MQSIQNQNKIKLADEFTYGRLARFTFPSIIIMIFSAFYGIVQSCLRKVLEGVRGNFLQEVPPAVPLAPYAFRKATKAW